MELELVDTDTSNVRVLQVGRPLAAALANAVDTGVVFHTAEFLFFNDGEDDDGTYVTPPLLLRVLLCVLLQ